jgi:hypothetical protein
MNMESGESDVWSIELTHWHDARELVATTCACLIFVVIWTMKASRIGHSRRMQAMGQRSGAPIGIFLN